MFEKMVLIGTGPQFLEKVVLIGIGKAELVVTYIMTFFLNILMYIFMLIFTGGENEAEVCTKTVLSRKVKYLLVKPR